MVLQSTYSNWWLVCVEVIVIAPPHPPAEWLFSGAFHLPSFFSVLLIPHLLSFVPVQLTLPEEKKIIAFMRKQFGPG